MDIFAGINRGTRGRPSPKIAGLHIKIIVTVPAILVKSLRCKQMDADYCEIGDF